MTGHPASRAGWRGRLGGAAHNSIVLWAVFVLAHLWLGFLNVTGPGLPLGDVTILYQQWAKEADYATSYVGIDGPWVYPVVALIPMVVAGIFGFVNYVGTWLSLIFVLDAVAFAAMVGWPSGVRALGRHSTAMGWWWTGFLFLLGPIAMGRIDSVTIPLAIVAVLFLATRPRVAAVLLTIAAWIKVWPAALIAAVVLASRSRLRVLVTALVTTAVVTGIALTLGSGANVFSFVTQQTGRALQVEAPVSTIWMWLSVARVPGAFVYYDAGINTFQVGGPGADVAAAVMTPVLAAAVLAIAALGMLAVRRGAQVTQLLAPLALALVAALIALNKVGSPQYITWLAVPVILGIATSAGGHGRSFRVPAIITLAIAALTQGIYPYLYTELLGLNPLLLMVLTVRNALVFALLIWAVGVLWELSRRFVDHEAPGSVTEWLPSPWPFGARADAAVGGDE